MPRKSRGQIVCRGYVAIYSPGHPRAGVAGNYVMEHVLVVERALGHHLPRRCSVHHINGIKSDNRPGNLVACESHAYHMLLERRTRALEACGHADWKHCWLCGEWGAPDGFRGGNARIHKGACSAAYERSLKAKKAA